MTPNEIIEYQKLEEKLKELKEELIGVTLDKDDAEDICEAFRGIVKGIIVQIEPAIQKALFLHSQEEAQKVEKLKQKILTNWKGQNDLVDFIDAIFSEKKKQ